MLIGASRENYSCPPFRALSFEPLATFVFVLRFFRPQFLVFLVVETLSWCTCVQVIDLFCCFLRFVSPCVCPLLVLLLIAVRPSSGGYWALPKSSARRLLLHYVVFVLFWPPHIYIFGSDLCTSYPLPSAYGKPPDGASPHTSRCGRDMLHFESWSSN